MFNINRETWKRMKEFAAMPAGKRYVIGTIVIIVILFSAIVSLAIYHSRQMGAAEQREKDCIAASGREKLEMAAAFSEALRKIEQEKTEIYKKSLQDALDKLKEKERILDQTVMRTDKVIAVQARTEAKLKTINN